MPLDADEQRQVEKFKAKMEPALAEARKWQAAINAVYEAAGDEPPFAIDVTVGGASPAAQQRRAYGRAEFFGQPLATVVKRVLTDCGPLDEHELFDKMTEGGFNFDETNSEKAKISMKISLGKNPAFGRTKTGFYTVTDGAPRRRPAKDQKAGAPDASANTDKPAEAAEQSGTDDLTT